MPRVGYVVKRYPRYSETFIVNELLAHEAAGMEAVIFALRPPNDTHFQDAIARVRAPVHYLPHAGLRARELWSALSKAALSPGELALGLEAAAGMDVVDVHQSLLLAEQIREHGLTHLHAHFASSPAAVARLAARLAGITYSLTAHAKDIFHDDVDRPALRARLGDASVVVTVSNFNVSHLRDVEGADPDRILRIYNGLDLETFPFEAPAQRPDRIVAVGRLVEKKGFGDLVEACSLLRDLGRHFSCRIIGAGPREGDLRNAISRMGLEGVVTMSGPLPQSEIRREVGSAAVFAAPCVVGEDGNRDGLPTTLLEAMALGTPCISTDVTGIPEILQHGETGLMVPQHAPKELAFAMDRLLLDPSERVRLAVGARGVIERGFDVHHNTARLRQAFLGANVEGDAR